MASQVLSGSGNVSYTNSTGQNVRLVINYLNIGSDTCTLTFEGCTVTLPRTTVYGKTLLYNDYRAGNGNIESSGCYGGGGGENRTYCPGEIALSNGATFAITAESSQTDIRGYNIIIIPEAG